MRDNPGLKHFLSAETDEAKQSGNGQAPPPAPEPESVPVTQHCYLWDRGVRPKHYSVEFRPLGRDPEAIENTFLHKFVWHAEGGGPRGPCSFTVHYTSGERVTVSGACLRPLFERLKRHLVFEVWAVGRNPLAEKALPEREGLVYDITIAGPEEEGEG